MVYEESGEQKMEKIRKNGPLGKLKAKKTEYKFKWREEREEAEERRVDATGEMRPLQ